MGSPERRFLSSLTVMTSLWHLTSPRIPSDSFRDDGSLNDGSARCDTVVVGAGLTGLMTAVLLARAGWAVSSFVDSLFVDQAAIAS